MGSTKFPDQIWLGKDVHGLVAGRSFLRERLQVFQNVVGQTAGGG
jgi:hypothetical protein